MTVITGHILVNEYYALLSEFTENSKAYENSQFGPEAVTAVFVFLHRSGIAADFPLRPDNARMTTRILVSVV